MTSLSCHSYAVRNYELNEQSNWRTERLQIIHIKETQRQFTEACLLNVDVKCTCQITAFTNYAPESLEEVLPELASTSTWGFNVLQK